MTHNNRRDCDTDYPSLQYSTSPLREEYASGSELPAAFMAFQPLFDLSDQVFSNNACCMSGCSIRYDTFIPAMWQAVAQGFVSHEHASFCANGLRWGFKAGIDTSRLLSNGHRWFRNYKTALSNSEAVTKAVRSRINDGKTLDLGPWTSMLAIGVRSVYQASAIFPMGATEKPMQPGVYRPTDDHTRTGINAASNLDNLRHGLTAYEDIANWLKQQFFMRVSDVDNAFPLLPLHPDVIPFFFFRWTIGSELRLLVHTHGDFGAAGMPGAFKIFFADVVVGMARAAAVLTLPMAVYVDDCSLIGENQQQVDQEMEDFQQWAWNVCGVAFKALKDRLAARHQLVLGLWWDSQSLSRTLDERKLLIYMEMIADYATRPRLTLHEMQVAGGRLQRVLLTFPPGAACLLTSLFTLMVGLKLPWHARKVSRKVRRDLAFIHKMLKLNMGRGYYSYDLFEEAPEVRSDASKKSSYSGGGYVSACGRYNFWQYGARAKRNLIDYLEGDVVVVAVEQLGHLWHKKRIPFGIDNMAFQKSAAKGRSKVERLNALVRELFALMIQFHCILMFFWLSSEDNLLADDLSRDKESAFLKHAFEAGFWKEKTTPVRHEDAGKIRTLPVDRGEIKLPQEEKGTGRSHNSQPRTRPVRAKVASKVALSLMCFFTFCQPASTMPLTTQEVSVPYTRSSIFGSALPCHLVSYVEDMLDNRLSDSSWRTVQGGMKIWKEVAEQERWSTILHTDDPDRGPKLVTLVCHMLQDTTLVWGSIESYVWGVRTWMMLQHQADPLMGVLGWQHFAKAAKLLSWVPYEPRKRVPAEVVRSMVADTDLSSFVDVQQTFLQLTLLYTFSRTECPCPKTFTGRQSYYEEEHWSVEDFVVGLCRVGSTLMGLWVRFKRIKQDPRVERNEAQGDGDWAFIGDIPNSDVSILYWYRKLMGLMGVRPNRKEAFFLDPDKKRPLLYHKALAQFKERQRRVGVKEEDLGGLHGLRVEGYNGTESALGDEVASAHGLWKSKCSKRYARFSMELIATIPAWIMGEQTTTTSTHDYGQLDNGQERDARAPKQRMNRRNGVPGHTQGQESNTREEDSSSESEPNVPDIEATSVAAVDELLPQGWAMEQRCTTNGRAYKVYVGPDGQRAQSRVHAWRVHEASRTYEEPSGSEGVEVEQTRVPSREVAARPTPPNVTPSSGRKSLAERLTQRRNVSSWLLGRFESNEASPGPNAEIEQDVDESAGASSLAGARPVRSQAAKGKPDRFVSRE